MRDETAWLIFGWSLMAVGWLNFNDSWKALPMFIMAVLVFIISGMEEKRK